MAFNLQCLFSRISATFEFNWFYISKQFKPIIINVKYFASIYTHSNVRTSNKKCELILFAWLLSILSHRFYIQTSTNQAKLVWTFSMRLHRHCTQCNQQNSSIGYFSNGIGATHAALRITIIEKHLYELLLAFCKRRVCLFRDETPDNFMLATENSFR